MQELGGKGGGLGTFTYERMNAWEILTHLKQASGNATHENESSCERSR